MKKVLAIILSVLMAISVMPLAFAAQKSVGTPATSYAAYDRAKVLANDSAYINSLSYDQIAGVVLDWVDREIKKAAKDFNEFAKFVGANVEVNGISDIVKYADYLSQLGGDFAKLDVSKLKTLSREKGDINFIYGVIEFMAANADKFGKVFAWTEDTVFDYGKVGEYIESLDANNEIRKFYENYLIGNDIQSKFVAEIASEMGYTVKDGETFDEVINNGIKGGAIGSMLRSLLKKDANLAAFDAFDLRSQNVYEIVKAYIALLQDEYKDQIDSVVAPIITEAASAVKGAKDVIKKFGENPPSMTIGYTGKADYATYTPASANVKDYTPNIYVNDQAYDTMKEYADEDLGIEVLKNSEMNDDDKALVATDAESWGKDVIVNASAGGETIIDNLKIDLSQVESAAIAALETAVNGKGADFTIPESIPFYGGQSVAFNISDAKATFSYKAYNDADSLGVQVKVESASAIVNITSPITATANVNLLDPDSTTIDWGSSATMISMAKNFGLDADKMVVDTLKTSVGTMFDEPAFATVVVNNLSGKIEGLEELNTLLGYIEENPAYDYDLLDFFKDGRYDSYKGAIAQMDRVLVDAADMILTDSGMSYFGISKDNSLDKNIDNIVAKANELLAKANDAIKSFEDLKKNNPQIAELLGDIEIPTDLGLVSTFDFSSKENLYVSVVNAAANYITTDGIVKEVIDRISGLKNLDAMTAAIFDLCFSKAFAALDEMKKEENFPFADFDYKYTAIDYANVAEDGAEDAVMSKAVDVLYYAATYGTGKINEIANKLIDEAEAKTGIAIGDVNFKLNVTKSSDWSKTLNDLVDRFIGLINGLAIPAGVANEKTNVWDKASEIVGIFPVESMFSNYKGLKATKDAFFADATDGNFDAMLSLFEVKEDKIAGDTPVTKALINASQHMVDAFFPGTVVAKDYEASLTVQEEFTSSANDVVIAQNNMVSINNRKANIVAAVLDLIRESGLLAGFGACAHANVEKIEAVVPTCVKDGASEGQKCSDCGTILVAPQVIPATGNHEDNDGDGLCDVCGKDLNPSQPSNPDDGGNDSPSGIAGFFAKIRSFFQRIIDFFKNMFRR